MSNVANTTVVQLPNLFTPMAFLPPTLARKMAIDIFASIGSLAILLWDVILHAPDDYKLLTKYRVNISLVIYCISRLTNLIYSIGTVIVLTVPIGNCNYVRHVFSIYPITVPSTTLLLVLRVCALYNNSRRAVALFSLSWLSVLATSIAVPMGITGVKVPFTNYCFVNKSNVSVVLTGGGPFLHDTIVFCATSWAFISFSYPRANLKAVLRILVLGDLPLLSKSILRDGQAYYLAVLLFNLSFIVLYLAGDVRYLGPCSLGAPAFALLNNVSCYIYRNLRFGLFVDDTITSSFIDKALNKPVGTPRPEDRVECTVQM